MLIFFKNGMSRGHLNRFKTALGRRISPIQPELWLKNTQSATFDEEFHIHQKDPVHPVHYYKTW